MINASMRQLSVRKEQGIFFFSADKYLRQIKFVILEIR